MKQFTDRDEIAAEILDKMNHWSKDQLIDFIAAERIMDCPTDVLQDYYKEITGLNSEVKS